MKYLLSLSFVFIFAGISKGQQFDYYPGNGQGQVIEHRYYTVSYSAEHRQPEWAAFELNREDLRVSVDDQLDPYVNPKVKAEPPNKRAFKKADMEIGYVAPLEFLQFSLIAYKEAHFWTNASPMAPGFIEDARDPLLQVIKNYVRTGDDLFFVSGPIFPDKADQFGRFDLFIPEAFYFIILDYQKPDYKMMAWLLPHEPGFKILPDHTISVDELEKKTQLDFFPELPDKLEDQLESKVDPEAWKVK
jgi:endonuclease G